MLNGFANWSYKLWGLANLETFQVRGIDYEGDEVKVAKWPKEIGAVPWREVCCSGCRRYVGIFHQTQAFAGKDQSPPSYG